jgi:hypothetical protein
MREIVPRTVWDSMTRNCDSTTGDCIATLFEVPFKQSKLRKAIENAKPNE